ncbi:MerR family transcriptional regulator [Clostridium amazonitimonense]|uniref:MerR family transcriptional regulator n=1 Tax=Clostridium amazonitimonense TaxID=1499689 RepID=UPI0009DFCCDD|nr:MerR family transcriptional regulator [Clostridium amazonitimonense]
MKAKILIGEMAKLHNISAQTLRYYDQIGLFKPDYIDEVNNYRYYGIEQFAQLDSILFLKKLGVPLKDIQKHFKERNLNSMIDVLKHKEIMIKKEIDILNRRCKSIEDKVRFMEEYMREDIFDKCTIKTLASRKIVYLDLEEGDSVIHFEYGLKELTALVKDDLCLFNGIISCIIDRNQLKNKKYNYYKSVALIFEEEDLDKNLKTLSGGKYATIAFKGDCEIGEIYYKKLLCWIEENNLEIAGDGIFLIITDSAFSELKQEYINEIQIPIK